MTERKTSSPNSRELLQLKDEISSRWEQLPVEHQATMALVLANRVLESEYGLWFKEALELQEHIASDDEVEQGSGLHISVKVSREQLRQLLFDEVELAQLTDRDLKEIGLSVAASFSEQFWDEVEHVTQMILINRAKDNPP